MPGGRANSSEVIAERGLIIGMWKAGASVLNIALKVGKITRTFKRSVGAEARQCLLPSNTRYHEKNINHLRSGQWQFQLPTLSGWFMTTVPFILASEFRITSMITLKLRSSTGQQKDVILIRLSIGILGSSERVQQ
ncbi:hypothetical protein Pcinc_020953 [Petrolisthes cinctipes]|uniref:Uncharacterized protein n=1 Tax=Petrolisthes cinctipes TaxID=88211 RepID=A0AAE1FLE5_PETCI|nr:hypothetical protein Pcinc_020953 [Petrolisthes cinctipes]